MDWSFEAIESARQAWLSFEETSSPLLRQANIALIPASVWACLSEYCDLEDVPPMDLQREALRLLDLALRWWRMQRQAMQGFHGALLRGDTPEPWQENHGLDVM